MLIDGGAPQVSLAEAEFKRMAKYWQDEAQKASYTAQHYVMLASSLSGTYRHLIGHQQQPRISDAER